jgi:hypothetical protein
MSIKINTISGNKIYALEKYNSLSEPKFGLAVNQNPRYDKQN